MENPPTADFIMFVFLVFNAHLIILFAYRSLPDIPNAIISMPLIRNAIEIIIANRTNPEIGCAITRIDTAILRTPTPMRKALDEPEAFFDMPCIILDMPLTSKAIAARTTKTADVNTGNCISTIEKAIINRPIPILAKRNRLEDDGIAIPTDILSIPTTSNITERIKMIVNIAGPMYAKITKDSTMHIPPKTI